MSWKCSHRNRDTSKIYRYVHVYIIFCFPPLFSSTTLQTTGDRLTFAFFGKFWLISIVNHTLNMVENLGLRRFPLARYSSVIIYVVHLVGSHRSHLQFQSRFPLGKISSAVQILQPFNQKKLRLSWETFGCFECVGE